MVTSMQEHLNGECIALMPELDLYKRWWHKQITQSSVLERQQLSGHTETIPDVTLASDSLEPQIHSYRMLENYILHHISLLISPHSCRGYNEHNLKSMFGRRPRDCAEGDLLSLSTEVTAMKDLWSNGG